MEEHMRLSLIEIISHFPASRIAAVTLHGGLITSERPPALASHVRDREAAARAAFAGLELSQIPGVAAWRSAYRGFGVKRTSYRSSVERLVKRVLAGDALPAINGFVDLYNAVSLEHVLCLGADDLDGVTGDVAFRYSRPGDTFRDMGAAKGEDADDPPKPGEVVYADADHVLCRRWNWRQDARTAVTPHTRRVLVTVQSHGWGDVETAAERLARMASDHFGMSARVAIADASRPVVDL
jgi:DNA/RNA-binding domain of Phe-tRNA-synthetase-like protein